MLLILLTTFSLCLAPPVTAKTFIYAKGGIHLYGVTCEGITGILTSFREAAVIEYFGRQNFMAIYKDTLNTEEDTDELHFILILQA